jgi:copper chaperone CopZ
MTTQTFHIPAISCHHCVHTIKTELSEMPGVKDVAGEAASKQVIVTFEPPASEEQIRELLKEINYEAE